MTSPDEPQTPRTDAQFSECIGMGGKWDRLADLSRQLELELIGSRRIIAEMGVELRKALEERDLAIAHDRQPYPTAAAYEAVCAALEHERMKLENERMKVAGCSTAAAGYWRDGDSISSSYDCAAIHDVALLYAKYVKAQERCAQAYEEAAEVCENHAIHVSNTEDAYATCVNCAREIRALAAIKP